MKIQSSIDFARLVQKFLTDYLPFQRGCARNTVLSYRDTFKLLVRFLKESKGFDLRKFALGDLTKSLVIEFLQGYRNSGASVAAANQRLAAIKCFADFAASENPDCIGSLTEIGRIKSTTAPGRPIGYLTPEQTAKLINKPDARNRTGLRNRAILTLLYDSGCRVQELCDLTVGSVELEGDPTLVHLHGKGDKYRTVFVSKATGELLRKYASLFLRRALKSDPFFTNKMRSKMDRDGINYLVKKYGALIAQEDPTFPRQIHCHMLRHSKAMHMLQAGIDLVNIRNFLGHVNISTTVIYARADTRSVEKAVNSLAPKLTGDVPEQDWSKDADLMEFLEKLK